MENEIDAFFSASSGAKQGISKTKCRKSSESKAERVLFLLDVEYDKNNNKAKLIFYDPKKKRLYYQFDTSGHTPYLITSLDIDALNEIQEVSKSKRLKKIKPVKKLNPFSNVLTKYNKVYGETPLEIGGNPGKSFREFIKPSYEANIRYHLNYIADMKLTPATFYSIDEQNQIQPKHSSKGKMINELRIKFENENPEAKAMLEEYAPLLFQSFPDILRAAYDIEVGSPQHILPNVIKAEYQIISIALVDTTGQKYFWVLNRKQVNQEFSHPEIKIRRFNKEAELLNDFFDVICSYPMVISFNGDNFDNKYIYNRARNVGIKNPPIIQKGNISTFEDTLHLDIHIFLRQPAIKLYAFGGRYESASLNDIATGLLGLGKLEYEDVWINEMKLEQLLKYNIRDAEITLELTKYENNLILNLIFTLMRITKLPFLEFTRKTVSSWIKFWLIWEHRKRNILIPSKEEISINSGRGQSEAMITGGKFQGAIVIDPKPGVWWDVETWDFASLYPSIIKTKNLSYETINCNHAKCKINKIPEHSHWVCTDKIGIMSLIIGFIRDLRVKYFKPLKYQQSSYGITEQALKVLINAGYGVIGSDKFDFYCLPVAESTTAYARSAIMKIKNYVTETLGIKVLYGDTDSIFIYNPSSDAVEKLKNWSIDNLGIEIERDYKFRYIVFSDLKKNYLGVTIKGQVIVKGLMGKKKNTPQLIKDYFLLMLNELQNVNQPEEFADAKNKIIDIIKEFLKRIQEKNFSARDIAIRSTLRSKIESYKTWTQAIQAVAQLIDAGEPNALNYDIGDEIKYIAVENKVTVKIPKGSPLAFSEGYRQATVKPIELFKIENDTIGESMNLLAESVFNQILYPLGINWKQDIVGQQSISDFF